MRKVVKAIKKAKTAVILPHLNADGDALASCRAMAAALHRLGIKSVIYAEEKVTERLAFVGDGIRIYNGESVAFDTCIVLDCGDADRTGERRELLDKAKVVVNIDHHKTNTKFGDFNYVDATASATGEILYDVIRKMGVKPTGNIARFLYIAICSDTGGFAYSNVSPKTFRIAAKLIGCDINHAEISRLLFDCVDIESEKLKAVLVRLIQSYDGGKIRTVTVTKALAEECGVEVKDIQDVVNLPRRIRGTEIAVALKETDKGIRISLRSNGNADVSRVALAFGGGGHIKAAGCTITDKTVSEAEMCVVDECRRVL